MRREFIMTKRFDERWKQMGLTDDDLRNLQNMLVNNSKIGVVIPALGGARKMRFAFRAHGKSGGIRIIYIDVVVDRTIYLITAYPKNVQEDLTPDQKKIILKRVHKLKGV